MTIKLTKFAGDAIILGEERYVEYADADEDGKEKLTLYGVSADDAERILDLIELGDTPRPEAATPPPAKVAAVTPPPAVAASPAEPAAKPTKPAKVGRTRVEKAPEVPASEPAVSPKHINGAANGATHTPAPVARAMPPAAVQEIRAAFGINPALLQATVKNRLVQAAVAEGLLDAPANGADVDETFYALGAAVPKGWFTDHAEAAKSGKKVAAKAAPPPVEEEDDDEVEVEAAADDEEEVEAPPAPRAKLAETGRTASAAPNKSNATNGGRDPAGLTPNGQGDPDEDPIEAPPPAAKAKPKKGAARGYDIEHLKVQGRLRDVLGHLYDSGYRAIGELVDVCTDIQQDVPVLARVANLDERIRRTAEVMGLDFGQVQATA